MLLILLSNMQMLLILLSSTIDNILQYVIIYYVKSCVI